MVQRKIDALVQEKADLIKENKSLLKQIEDLKSSNLPFFCMPVDICNFSSCKSDVLYSRSENAVGNFKCSDRKREGLQDTG